MFRDPLICKALQEIASVIEFAKQPGSDTCFVAPPAGTHPVRASSRTFDDEIGDRIERAKPRVDLRSFCLGHLSDLARRNPKLIFSLELCMAVRGNSLIEAHETSTHPEPVRCIHQGYALRPTARRELHHIEPIAMICQPEPRSPLLPETNRSKLCFCRRSDNPAVCITHDAQFSAARGMVNGCYRQNAFGSRLSAPHDIRVILINAEFVHAA